MDYDEQGTDETSTWEHHTYRTNTAETPEPQRQTNFNRQGLTVLYID